MITIRPVEQGDLGTFYEHQSDPIALEMAVFGARDHDTFMAHWQRIIANPDGIARAVLLDGAVAGNVLVWSQEGRRYVGYWIGRDFWGRGVATEALRLVLEEVRDRPMHAWVALSNRGSVRVLEKSGFVRVEPQPHPNQGDVPEQLMILE